MRVIGAIVLILGLASLVLGIVFMIEASDGRQEVADSIAPLPLDILDETYDQLKAGIEQMKEAGMQPDISKSLEKTGLGLARANVGKARMQNVNGIVDIIIGAGLILTGVAIYKKAAA